MQRYNRILFVVVATVLPGLSWAQARAESGSRVMQSQAFREWSRVQPSSTDLNPSRQSLPAAVQQLGDSFIGMNLWHMRLASADAPVKMRGLKHPDDPKGVLDWTPVRVSLSEPVAEGEAMRISLESARKGYLYVVDRDIYSNGQKGAPTLIFPTKRIRGGKNNIEPGVPIEIPTLQDNPPYFVVERTRPDQTAIQLTVVVSLQPLPEVFTQLSEQQLREDQVVGWERQWGSQVSLTEDQALVGKVYTLAERNAASNAARPLGEHDAIPVSLFYRPGHAGEPMVATAMIQLKPRSRP
jgi:hypothetical protein